MASDGELRSFRLADLAEALWRHDAAGGGQELRRRAVADWADPASRARLHVELLRSDLSRSVTASGLAAQLVEAADELNNRELTIELCRGIYEDTSSTSKGASWADFAVVGYSAEELQLMMSGESLFLGQIVLDRFKIERRIGRGSFGVVYQADDRLTGMAVALKSSYGDSPKQRRKAAALLQKESGMLHALMVSGLPRHVKSADRDVEPPFLAMEYVEGKLLSDVLAAGAMPHKQAAECVAAVAETVNALHRAGFVHCDLKPSNIIIRPDGSTCVLDLGVTLAERNRFDNEHRFRGTINYMSPEALRGRATELDGRADIWSLGAIFYEMLTGRMLHVASTRRDALHAVLSVQRGAPSLAPDVPVRLSAICRRCLQFDPNLRYDTATCLAAELYAWLNIDYQLHDDRSRDMLYGWRLGTTIGSCINDARRLSYWIDSLETAAGHEDAIVDEKHKCFDNAICCGLDLWMSLGKANAVSDSAGLGMFPSLRASRRLYHFCCLGDRTAGVKWLVSELPGIWKHLDVIATIAMERVSTASERAAACFELAKDTRAMMLTGTGNELSRLDKVRERAGIDGITWTEFNKLAGVPGKLDQAIIGLNMNVERQGLFGSIDTGFADPAMVIQDNPFNDF